LKIIWKHTREIKKEEDEWGGGIFYLVWDLAQKLHS
jgi:hypothetical protein